MKATKAGVDLERSHQTLVAFFVWKNRAAVFPNLVHSAHPAELREKDVEDPDRSEAEAGHPAIIGGKLSTLNPWPLTYQGHVQGGILGLDEHS